jgi:hypothetical protein
MKVGMNGATGSVDRTCECRQCHPVHGEYPIAVDAADLVALSGAARIEAAVLYGWRPLRARRAEWVGLGAAKSGPCLAGLLLGEPFVLVAANSTCRSRGGVAGRGESSFWVRQRGCIRR